MAEGRGRRAAGKVGILMDGKIWLRDKKWLEWNWMKMMLMSLQDLQQLQYLLETDTFDHLIYFVLSLFPIEETAMENGNVTDEYEYFVDHFTEYTTSELYDKLMKGSEEE